MFRWLRMQRDEWKAAQQRLAAMRVRVFVQTDAEALASDLRAIAGDMQRALEKLQREAEAE